MSVDDAYEALGLQRGEHHPEPVIRKAYYRLAQKLHPDKNPQGRVCSLYICSGLSLFFLSVTHTHKIYYVCLYVIKHSIRIG